MPVIDATVGGVAANSYIDLADAIEYFGTRLHTTRWDNASATDREKALLMAARILDTRVVWKGTRTTLEQAMQWPRYGVPDPTSDEMPELMYDEIPNFLRDAQCELALALLSEDLTLERDSRGLRSVTIDTLSFDFDKSDERPSIARAARELIEPYVLEMTGTGGFAAVPVVRV